MSDHTATFPREVAALAEVFDLVHAFVGEQGLDEKTRFGLDFVVEELFTNFVKYNTGSCSPIRVSLRREGSELVLELIDEDVDPFDPSELAAVDTTLPAQARRPGGLGIHLVRSIVDEISYSYRDRRMTVRARKRLET